MLRHIVLAYCVKKWLTLHTSLPGPVSYIVGEGGKRNPKNTMISKNEDTMQNQLCFLQHQIPL